VKKETENMTVKSVGLRAGLAQALRPFDITPEQFAILSILNESDSLQQSEISDLLLKDRPNISRILERLQKKKLVKRETDNQDRRAVRVYISPSGKKIFPEIEKTVLEFQAQTYRGLSPAERQQLMDTLHLISRNIA
jgi:DNA-binding MarR family transcriptional regulator